MSCLYTGGLLHKARDIDTKSTIVTSYSIQYTQQHCCPEIEIFCSWNFRTTSSGASKWVLICHTIAIFPKKLHHKVDTIFLSVGVDFWKVGRVWQTNYPYWISWAGVEILLYVYSLMELIQISVQQWVVKMPQICSVFISTQYIHWLFSCPPQLLTRSIVNNLNDSHTSS